MEVGRGSHAAVPVLGAWEIRAEPRAAAAGRRGPWKRTSELWHSLTSSPGISSAAYPELQTSAAWSPLPCTPAPWDGPTPTPTPEGRKGEQTAASWGWKGSGLA